VAIPDYQALMRSSLQALADGQERTPREIYDLVATIEGITDDERAQLIPSGTQTMFNNRVSWAVSDMAKAGLIVRPRRGVASITDRGRKVLEEYPDRIDLAVLRQFPEFLVFRDRQPRKSPVDPDPVPSPTEAISALVEEVNATVAAEVLQRVLAQPPVFLERLVLTLLQKMGYGGIEAMSEHLGGSGDQGLDGVIRQDALGLDVVYVQAKRYAPDRTIGRPDIQAFVGALNGARAERGIFITTSSFSRDARTYVDRVQTRLVLIDGAMLAREMVARNVGVDVRESHEVKRIDEDFFEE
jgi:restriction system protein